VQALKRSRLTETANAALAMRMQTWFRLFIDESVQEAVAAIFLARLESFLSAPIELTREDRQVFMDTVEPDVEEDEQGEPPANEQDDNDNSDEE